MRFSIWVMDRVSIKARIRLRNWVRDRPEVR